ncbi:MAG: hypothetical protein OEY13_14510 [Gammaproteobacteria bacterium]|nr:hypothetical protein [Gammaproteobacteria bacterium]MDH5274275.1 hypothetical protein [Gammaproteobacteria bacterium]
MTVAQSPEESVAPPPPPPANMQFDFTVTTFNDPNGACTIPMIPENGGNLQTTLPVPGPQDKPDHKIIWSSAQEFSLMFEAVGEPGKPKPSPPDLGDEKKGEWNVPTKVKDSNPARYEFRLKLKTGSGNETVVAKYTVKIAGCARDYDPVIIVGR